MKNSIKLMLSAGAFAITLALFAFSSPSSSEDAFVILKTMESNRGVTYPDLMVVSYSDGETETVELDLVRNNGENSEDNLKKITEMISKIQSKGYKIDHMSGGGGYYGVTYQYHFVRK